MQNLEDLVKSGDVDAIRQYMNEHDLVVRDGRIVPRDEEVKKKLKSLETFWNQRQQSRKILLNSLYGALLNEALRFNDPRLGQSTTLTGRSVVRHMISKTNEVIAGSYEYDGAAIVYGDTDSCYFSAYEILKNDPVYKDFDHSNESYIQLYDAVSDTVNDSFADFMHRTFNTGLERGSIIKAGRELVGSSGLFIKKKKYAILMYDKEGTRLDVNGKEGKLKAMGLDLKRADTPKFMQKFLEEILMDVLLGATQEDIFSKVRDFRVRFKERPSWEKGSPKMVKGLTKYIDILDKVTNVSLTLHKGKSGKPMIPGHVTASINWNRLKNMNGDLHTPDITDGTRIVVCALHPNANGMKDVAFPIDVHESQLPPWFKELPFDDASMETKIIDAKLDNLLGVMEWNFAETQEILGDEFFTF